MHAAEKLSLDQIETFLKASQEIRFESETQEPATETRKVPQFTSLPRLDSG